MRQRRSYLNKQAENKGCGKDISFVKGDKRYIIYKRKNEGRQISRRKIKLSIGVSFKEG